MLTARGARVVRQVLAEIATLRASLAPYLSSADDVAQSLGCLLAVSRGQVAAADLLQTIATYCPELKCSQWNNQVQVAAAHAARSLRGIDWDQLFEQAAERMGDRSGAYVVETILTADNRQQRRSRGIYFTPAAIVQLLVRVADQLLRRELNIQQGLAACADSERPLRIVDPACGAGVFLSAAWQTAARYLPPAARARCLRQFYGFDVLLPNVVASHWLLQELGGEHVRQLNLAAHSALSADSEVVLQGSGPLVVLGNPPYANFGRLNRDPWILQLLADYKADLQERKHNVGDDYLKFIRWAQHHLQRAGSGVLAFVTNHAYLTAITHRQVRRSLQQSFADIYVLDLGGRLSDRVANDENVFGIRAGVAITVMVRKANAEAPGAIHYAALRGSRAEKLEKLQQASFDDLAWRAVNAQAPQFYFAPQRQRRKSGQYQSWPALQQIFQQFVSGVQTKNDQLFVDRHYGALAERMQAHIARQQAEGRPQPVFSSDRIRPYLVAPFDQRWIYYEPTLLGRARLSVMRHMLDEDNVGFVFMRQSTNPGEYDHFLVTRHLVSDRVFYSGHGAPFLAPLYLYQDGGRLANFQPPFMEQLQQRLHCQSLAAADVLAYIYGVVHDDEYRRRWHDCLKVDFPRIPWPETLQHYQLLVDRGAALMRQHLSMADTAAAATADAEWCVAAGYPQFVPRNFEQGTLHLSQAVAIADVPCAAWERRIGGYAVLPRWLKQRRESWLSGAEVHYLQWLIKGLAGRGEVSCPRL